jgi:prepilin-type N-terminal cleavage/methylation domain-containing protein
MNMRLKNRGQKGFSMLELLIAMTIMLMLLAIVSTLIGRSFAVRARESRQTDALATAQAALNVMSREISNAGFGIYDNETSQLGNNGIVLADSGANRIHLRTNVFNTGPRTAPPGSTVLSTIDPGEDVTYFFDAATASIVRYDPHDTPQTSVVVNRISNVTFRYFDYALNSSTPTGPHTVPSATTGRVQITVEVRLEPVVGQPDNQTVTFTSEVTLRNVNYMLQQY